ncbi:hypothetical protein TNCV_139811 [Trichonephila clavipes]|uniref:Uncharacterized protein n=1 Tax=Trichonephila clavipes TaxID=2585209 RepID=A0A8X6RI83_TRICX|nr:hypothetical protein TNCV_139811 [Trichonephila clavipes]
MSSFLVLRERDNRNRWRDGQVCLDVGQGIMALWARWPVCFGVLCANSTREAERDFCDLPIRRNEGRVVDPPLVFKRDFFQETKNYREEPGPGWRKRKNPCPGSRKHEKESPG